jgi:hypothetical protein
MNRERTTPSVQNQIGQLIKIVVISIIGIAILSSTCNMFESLDVHKVMVIQSPLAGNLTWHTSAGVKWQGWGKVTKYDKRSIYKFSIPVRFNDAGHATMTGSVQFEFPLDVEHLNKIQSKFGNEEAVKTQLIQTVVNKCLYMTGPMMSSRESYAEKRSYLINYVEDQIQNGIYKTIARDTTIHDVISGTEKSVTVIEIAQKNGLPERQEAAVLKEFGIKTFNFSIEKLDYDATVEQQKQTVKQMPLLPSGNRKLLKPQPLLSLRRLGIVQSLWPKPLNSPNESRRCLERVKEIVSVQLW